jgi:mitochondrial import inner membrane translocase subunit TIM44
MNRLRCTAVRSSRSARLGSFARAWRQTAVNCRFLEQTQRSNIHLVVANPSKSAIYSYPPPLRSEFLPNDIRTASATRDFHYGSRLGQEKETKTKSEPPKEGSAEEDAPRQASSEKSEAGDEKTKEEKEKDEGEGGGKKEGDKKEPPPPPPPHGDKSPWQVFTETLKTEFQSSKEWNESTKALAAGAQQFTENESVRRAREAYESTTGAVSSTTANVLKNTAGAVGKGAAWTWETPVVKAARVTVNATASVIEKGTRPIRETEAFKNVKNVIDDGSSSRYGGWVEKEERRKARELRELEEAQAHGGTGRRVEVPKENPE